MSIRLFALAMTAAALSAFAAPAAGQPPAAGGVTLTRHEGPVVFVAYTPNGKHIITVIYEGAIRKWGAATGKEVQQIERSIKLDGSTGDVRCRSAAVSPDGKFLGVLTYASTLNIYALTFGKLYGQIVTGGDQLSGAFAAAFAPDGKSVATSRFQGRAVTQWDLANGKEIRRFGDDTKPKGVAASRTALAIGGKVLVGQVTETANGQLTSVVKRWDIATGKELSVARGPSGGTASVVFAHDGKRAAWGSAPGTVRLWEL